MGKSRRIRVTLKCLLIAGAAWAFLRADTAQPRTFRLQPLSETLGNLIDRNAKLVAVASGFGFTEGPVWDPEGFLYVSDETINKLFRVYRDGRKVEIIA